MTSVEPGPANAAAAYDELPYPSLPRAATQPDRLAVIARLLGLAPARPSTARVLEIGCSDGGNLLATALAHPAAEVVGIDISPGQIEAGRAAARALGVENLRLEVMDLRDAARLGTFDHVIAHGLYSWLPPALQPELLRVMAAILRPHGVAYVGLSVLPGSDTLVALQAILARRTATAPDPRARVHMARALAETLAELAPPPTRELFRVRRDLVRGGSDAWVRHELLAEENHPVWFHELARAARASGLQYLADADLPSTLPSNHLDPERLARFDRVARDPLEREQLLDELVNRSFRRALFVRADANVERRISADRLDGLSAVARFRSPGAWSEVAEGAHESYTADAEGPRGRGDAPPGELRTRHGTARAALRLLAERWPAAVPVADLAATAREHAARAGWTLPPPDAHEEAIVREHVLIAFTRGLVDLWMEPPSFVTTASERPVASALARWRAARDLQVVNLRHEGVPLEPHERLLLAALDGARDRAALTAELAARAATGDLLLTDGDRPVVDPAERDQLLRGIVDHTLAWFGRASLLVG